MSETTIETTLTPNVIEAPVKARKMPRTFAALNYRNYRLFFSGMLVSAAGTWMQTVAQAWLVYELSQSEWMLGIVGFAAAIPAIAVSPWAGVLVDRVPKRKILVATQIASMIIALTLAVLALTGWVEVWHVIVMAALTGMVSALDAPARQALVPELIEERKDLSNAIALNAMVFNGARVTGPAIGGLLLVTVGAGWCFAFNGFSYLAVIAGLLLMRLPDEGKIGDQPSALAQMKSGAAYIRQDKTIMGIIAMSAALCLFGVSYATILPAFVDKSLGAAESAYANVMAAQGIGAVVGAVLLATYGDQIRRGWLVTAANFYFPVVLFALAFTSSFPLALVLMFMLGLGFISLFNQMNVLLQIHVDNEMRGRVMSVYTLTFFGISPFGNLLIGAFSESWGITPALATSAVITLACAGLIHYFVPEIRKL